MLFKGWRVQKYNVKLKIVKGEMKVLGGQNLPPPGERFDRLQRTAGKLLGITGVCPKGVFRFKTFEEFDEWKIQIASRRGFPSK